MPDLDLERDNYKREREGEREREREREREILSPLSSLEKISRSQAWECLWPIRKEGKV